MNSRSAHAHFRVLNYITNTDALTFKEHFNAADQREAK